MGLEPIKVSEVSQKEKEKYCILTHTHIYIYIYKIQNWLLINVLKFFMVCLSSP